MTGCKNWVVVNVGVVLNVEIVQKGRTKGGCTKVAVQKGVVKRGVDLIGSFHCYSYSYCTSIYKLLKE